MGKDESPLRGLCLHILQSMRPEAFPTGKVPSECEADEGRGKPSAAVDLPLISRLRRQLPPTGGGKPLDILLQAYRIM